MLVCQPARALHFTAWHIPFHGWGSSFTAPYGLLQKSKQGWRGSGVDHLPQQDSWALSGQLQANECLAWLLLTPGMEYPTAALGLLVGQETPHVHNTAPHPRHLGLVYPLLSVTQKKSWLPRQGAHTDIQGSLANSGERRTWLSRDCTK